MGDLVGNLGSCACLAHGATLATFPSWGVPDTRAVYVVRHRYGDEGDVYGCEFKISIHALFVSMYEPVIYHQESSKVIVTALLTMPRQYEQMCCSSV